MLHSKICIFTHFKEYLLRCRCDYVGWFIYFKRIWVHSFKGTHRSFNVIDYVDTQPNHMNNETRNSFLVQIIIFRMKRIFLLFTWVMIMQLLLLYWNAIQFLVEDKRLIIPSYMTVFATELLTYWFTVG